MGASTGPTSPEPSRPPTSSPQTSPPFTASPLTPEPSGPPEPSGKNYATTIRGSMQEGVEAGCLLLKADDGKLYLLLGGDRRVIAGGGRLEVVGTAQPGLMTTCQQGTPFMVSSVRAA